MTDINTLKELTLFELAKHSVDDLNNMHSILVKNQTQLNNKINWIKAGITLKNRLEGTLCQ
jgi:hypothetical protein